MDGRLYEEAIRGDGQRIFDPPNQDVDTQEFIGPLIGDDPSKQIFLNRVMRECRGKDNPLHLGALFGNVDFVLEILRLKPEFARKLNSQGQSPLHLAAERGHVEVVKKLLVRAADVCFFRDRHGRIPLHLAAIKGRVKVVEELVKTKKITAWLLTDKGEPILHLCAKHDQFDALEKLVTLVRDHEFVVGDDEFVRLKDSSDNTILHLLSAKKQKKMVEFLLEQPGIEQVINDKNVDKLTALDEVYLAKGKGDISDLTEILARKGAKTSSDLLTKLTEQDSKWLERMEPSFLVIAVLVASVTYAAVLTPPGGFWQEDYQQPGSIQNHTAGDPILWSKDRPRYYMFYISNSIGFFSSLAIIFVIIVGKHTVYSPTNTLLVLNYSTGIVALSLMLSYGVSHSKAGPGWLRNVTFLFSYYVFFFGLIFVPYIIKSCSKILRMQRNGEGSQQNP